jgi:hypothetical protein
MTLKSTPRLAAAAAQPMAPDVQAEVLAGLGADRARSHCRFVLQLNHFISDSPTYFVPLLLKRQCDRTAGADQTDLGPRAGTGAPALARRRVGRGARNLGRCVALAARRRRRPRAAAAAPGAGAGRVISDCYFAVQLDHFILDSLRLSVPLFLKRQCDRTVGTGDGRVSALWRARCRAPRRVRPTPASAAARVISDCHFAVQLRHFIPGFLSYSVTVFLQ